MYLFTMEGDLDFLFVPLVYFVFLEADDFLLNNILEDFSKFLERVLPF